MVVVVVELSVAHTALGQPERDLRPRRYARCARGENNYRCRTGLTCASSGDNDRVKRDLARVIEAAVREVDDAQGVRYGGVEAREREERVLDGRINVISVATFPNTSST